MITRLQGVCSTTVLQLMLKIIEELITLVQQCSLCSEKWNSGFRLDWRIRCLWVSDSLKDSGIALKSGSSCFASQLKRERRWKHFWCKILPGEWHCAKKSSIVFVQENAIHCVWLRFYSSWLVVVKEGDGEVSRRVNSPRNERTRLT